jgi:peptidoglycan/LPS O-acetylase OafA/YrhL
MTANAIYRPEIDGLRAIAVLSVVFFHAKFPFFNGGFVGVDVFFVISGFLITRIIVNDLSNSRFRFSEFYLRRARRLFPALFATIAITFAASLFILMPTDMEQFSRSVVASLLWSSNFFFWTEAGYFDNTAYAKPLLHTWSLCVEEQFYLFWPSLLLLASRITANSSHVLGIVLFLTVGSFFFGLWQISFDSYAAFFMPFSRIAEFGIGAVLVWCVDKHFLNNWLKEVLLASGLILIALSVVIFDESTLFPGVPSLVTCLGAALCIYAGSAKYLGFLLRNKIAVFIGLISYSLYLVHWPVIVFIDYQNVEFSSGLRIFSVIFSVLLAIILNKYVENKFRKPSTQSAFGPKKYTSLLFAASSLIAVPAIAIVLFGGWEERWDMPKPIMMGAASIESRRIASFKYVDDSGVNNLNGFDIGQKINVVIIGDSHSKDLFNAIYLNREQLPNFSFYRLKLDDDCYVLFSEESAVPISASVRKECETDMVRMSESGAIAASDWVLIAPRWKNSSVANLTPLANYLKVNFKANVAVVGRTAEFKNVPKLFRIKGNLDNAKKYLALHREPKISSINNYLKDIAETNNLLYLDKVNAICSDDFEECEVLDSDGNIIYFDYGHWTLEGARHIGAKLIEVGFFESLRQAEDD